jgi:acetyl-CoA C-acetyltransferase
VEDVAIIGVGLHRFGRHPGKSAIDMGADAIRDALHDAGATWQDVQVAFGGSLEVDACDAIVNRMGLTGLRFHNVFNGCATSATALSMTANAIRFGEADLGVAVGLDKHPAGAFTGEPEAFALPDWYGHAGFYLTTQYFGMKINRYMHDHGIGPETLAKVAAKNYRNGSINPNAFRRKPLTEEQILEAPMLNYPLTGYMFCAPDEGAAAAILCRADRAREFTDTPIYLRATTVRTRRLGAFEVLSPSMPITAEGRVDGPTVDASKAAYEIAGIGPEDVDVAQLQDTDAGAEVMHMAENGFCEHGEQPVLVESGATEITGSLPVNTDGGLIANGEPIGASGLRQVYELVQQLRGTAGERQVPNNPKVGYAQLYGAPGIAGVSILTR